MGADQLAALARQRAEALLLSGSDRARLYRVDVDESSGVGADGRETYPTTELYAGACRIRPDTGSRQVDAADSQLGLDGLLVQVPFTVAGVREGDLLDVTACADADLTGRTLRVVRVERGTHVSLRRLHCEVMG